MSDAFSGGATAATALRASLFRSGRWAGGIAAVGGFVSDVLQPIAPFAAWIAIAAAIAAVLLAVGLLFKAIAADRAGPALVFAVATLAVTGGLWATQRATAAENGVFADLIPAIAQIQQSLGIIQQKIEKIEAKVDDIGAKTDEIAESVAAIAEAFANLGKQGGLIAEPSRPEEFYHNARIHELGGDMVNARAAYLAFARFGVDAIDPYLRLATLLRVQDGRAGAREVIGELGRQKPSTALELIHLLQFDDAQRIEKLVAFLKAHPEHGPAWKFFADEYSEDKLGQRSLADKRSEGEALDKFLAFEPDGRLVPYFVDHSLLDDWLQDAKRRKTALGDLGGASFQPTLQFMPGNQGITAVISLPEPATAIFWRMAGEAEFRNTGLTESVDQRTGKPAPRPNFELTKDTKSGTIEIKYADLRGREVGPFSFPFDPAIAVRNAQRMMLEQSWTSWLVFDASGFRGNVYFSQIASLRCAVKAVRYGLNDGPLDKSIELPPCDVADPYALPDGFLPYFKVGEEVKSIRLQIDWADGTQSEVKTFNRG
ncbi:MAG: methyl-accepting chemotaxis protein [Phyllobacteriaceae bacterium]|nr:methyl-accepting chemotaxis protein [Phyllobacteriaceae bacterium]